MALQLGHRAITIDNNSAYTSEARERLAAAPAMYTMVTEGRRKGPASERTSPVGTGVPAKTGSGNVIDLMDVKKSLGQKTPPKKMSSHIETPAKSKRAGAARALGQAVNAHKECPSPPNPENKLCKGKPIAYLVARKFQKVGNETDPCRGNLLRWRALV